MPCTESLSAQYWYRNAQYKSRTLLGRKRLLHVNLEKRPEFRPRLIPRKKRDTLERCGAIHLLRCTGYRTGLVQVRLSKFICAESTVLTEEGTGTVSHCHDSVGRRFDLLCFVLCHLLCCCGDKLLAHSFRMGTAWRFRTEAWRPA